MASQPTPPLTYIPEIAGRIKGLSTIGFSHDKAGY